MIGTVDTQMAAAEVAILTSTIAHPERRGALLVEQRTLRESNRADLPGIERDWTARAPLRRLIHAARLAIAAGDAETAAQYVDVVVRRWAS